MRVGAKLPSSGASAKGQNLVEAAVRAETAGFDSLWVSDHVVMPKNPKSRYPFSADGEMTWDPRDPWYDALIAMTSAAAVTSRVEVGVAVLVVPMRNPIILAKQLSSMDALSGGRVTLGAGAGWLEDEFIVLNSRFDTRGERLDEWIEILRDFWTGEPQQREYDHYKISEDLLAFPSPAHKIPILVGGMSIHALRRVSRTGDGWIAIQDADKIGPPQLRAHIETIGSEAHNLGRATPDRFVLRAAGQIQEVARQLPELTEVGITDVVVDVDWKDDLGPDRALDILLSE